MAIKIGIVNQKGGVGKTTTAICLTDALTQIGYKVLLVDFDPQGNSSSVFLAKDSTYTIYDGIIDNKPLKDIVITGNDMGDIIPANSRLTRAYNELVIMKAAENKLKKALLGIEKDYDVVIIDSSPSANIMMDNVLTAVDGIVIPMEAEEFSIDGLSSLLKNVSEVQEELNPALKVYGVLLTKYDQDKSVQKNIKAQFEKLDESIVHTFKTIIRDSAAIPKTQGFMEIDEPTNISEQKVVNPQGSIYKYGINNGALDYSAFAQELLEVIASGK